MTKILILGHLTYIFQGLCEIWDPKIDFSGMKKKYTKLARLIFGLNKTRTFIIEERRKAVWDADFTFPCHSLQGCNFFRRVEANFLNIFLKSTHRDLFISGDFEPRRPRGPTQKA